jgi:serine/threonine protein kinase
MPNRSLDIHLFQSGRGGGVFLDWGTRYQIAVGIARGLSYLHDGCRDRIIHCDVKPENILLDASLLPKIADFGMAKFVGRDFSRVLTTVRGTKGYLAPEWISGTAVTPKVDVYSYGMVLLELVSGRRNAAGEEYRTTSGDAGEEEELAFFPMKAARELVKGPGVVSVSSLLDDKLCGDADLVEVERACKVACWCIQDDEADRPTMAEVVQVLEGVLDCDMPPLPRLLATIFGRPHSSTEQQTTTVSDTSTSSGPFTSGSQN